MVSERSDTTGICLLLSSDALVEWEDAVSGGCDLYCEMKTRSNRMADMG